MVGFGFWCRVPSPGQRLPGGPMPASAGSTGDDRAADDRAADGRGASCHVRLRDAGAVDGCAEVPGWLPCPARWPKPLPLPIKVTPLIRPGRPRIHHRHRHCLSLRLGGIVHQNHPHHRRAENDFPARIHSYDRACRLAASQPILQSHNPSVASPNTANTVRSPLLTTCPEAGPAVSSWGTAIWLRLAGRQSRAGAPTRVPASPSGPRTPGPPGRRWETPATGGR